MTSKLQDFSIEKISLKILEKMSHSIEIDRIDYLKCKLGIETFLTNITKIPLIYLLAFMIGIPFQVFLFHFAYMSIRRYAFGAHCNSSVHCTIVSCVILIGIPTAIIYFQISQIGLLLLCIINHLLLNQYAPASTRKNGLVHFEIAKKMRYKKRVLLINLVLSMIASVIPNIFLANLIVLGITVATLMVTPLMNNLFRNERIEM
ncbi:MAG: accessory gene regulator B family protein [Turicibacter sp.]|nr:accessory gene regulator B family protein [Turicibacter sp.]